MAARRGVTRKQLADAALAVLDAENRIEAVKLGAVAKRLGIRSQSLYAHVEGVAGLRRLLALWTLEELTQVVMGAAVGRSGRDAVDAILRANLAFAIKHPGRFEASLHPPGNDLELAIAVERAGQPLQSVLTSLGLDAEQRIHWIRLQLSLIVGFTTLVQNGRLTLAPNPLTTVDHVVATLLDRLERCS